MIKVSFTRSGGELTYGAGIHDELANIANTIEKNTCLQLEHFERSGDNYALWFITSPIHELLMTKGEMGFTLIEQPSGIELYKSKLGLRQIKWEEDFI